MVDLRGVGAFGEFFMKNAMGRVGVVAAGFAVLGLAGAAAG